MYHKQYPTAEVQALELNDLQDGSTRITVNANGKNL